MLDKLHHGPLFITDSEVELNLWAPSAPEVWVIQPESGEKIRMQKVGSGFHRVNISTARDLRYVYSLGNGKIVADPASRFQPEGVSGPSMLVNPNEYQWRTETWKTYGMKESIIQEIHIGAYSTKGNYSGVKERIPHMLDIGINTVELMPLAQCYGSRNWGYDGVFPFAPNFSFGKTDDLKNLVDTLHANSISVILDVVYNHFGPIGGVFHELGPYFSNIYRNPWGEAINYDSGGSDAVRSFILENVDYWIREFRFDGLRLDSIHSIYDSSPVPILNMVTKLRDKLEDDLGRKIKLIAESDRNDPLTVLSANKCGMGMDAQWNDDFHHAIHAYLTGENAGYYMDYGAFDQIVHSFTNGFVYDGVYSMFLNRMRGSRFKNVPAERLIVYTQNHDQVGNRAYGDRPVLIMGDAKVRLFAASVLLSPFTPMIFMGEENGEQNPFLFFADSDDATFTEAIRQGRREEFAAFGWDNSIPDPFDKSSFMASVLDWNLINQDRGRKFNALYRDLIKIRKQCITGQLPTIELCGDDRRIIRLKYEGIRLVVYLSFSTTTYQLPAGNPNELLIDTSAPKYGGLNHRKENYGVNITIEPYSAIAILASGNSSDLPCNSN